MTVQELLAGKFITLTTYTDDGVACATPVFFVPQGERRLVVLSKSSSGKVERARRVAQVGVASCTGRGKVIGPMVAGTARVLHPAATDVARAGLVDRYGLLARALTAAAGDGDPLVGIEIVIDGNSPDTLESRPDM